MTVNNDVSVLLNCITYFFLIFIVIIIVTLISIIIIMFLWMTNLSRRQKMFWRIHSCIAGDRDETDDEADYEVKRPWRNFFPINMGKWEFWR